MYVTLEHTYEQAGRARKHHAGGGRRMICTSSLYESCQELFAEYPLAVDIIEHDGQTVPSMVLMLREGDDARFFTLSRREGEGKTAYVLRSWPAGDVADIMADHRGTVSDVAINTVTSGVPLPQDGSLFGWTHGDAITALVAVYTQYTPTSPVPVWTMMPLAGVPETQWPPFTDEHLFGPWFWNHFRAGSITFLNDLIADTTATVFWVDTKAVLGSDCCVVKRDITGPAGQVLHRGRYVYYQALRAGTPVPSLTALLADTGKTDLSCRFW